MRNSLIPVITYIGLDIGFLLGGAIITESIFNIQGVGGLVARATRIRENATVIGVTTILVLVILVETSRSTCCTPSSTRGSAMTEQIRESEVVSQTATNLLSTGTETDPIPTRSLGRDAWLTLRSNWVFWFSITLIILFLVMAIAPSLLTHKDPNDCNLANSRLPPSSKAWFGYDIQGCDVYSRTIYGARASIGRRHPGHDLRLVLGAGSGSRRLLRRVPGSVLSRITDIFFGIPVLLGGDPGPDRAPGQPSNQFLSV